MKCKRHGISSIKALWHQRCLFCSSSVTALGVNTARRYQIYIEMSAPRLVFSGDHCCFSLLLFWLVFILDSDSLCVCVCPPDQSTTTNLCIPDFSLLPVLLYPLRFKSEPIAFCVSPVAWNVGHALLLNLNNPRLHLDIEAIPSCCTCLSFLMFLSLFLPVLCLVIFSLQSYCYNPDWTVRLNHSQKLTHNMFLFQMKYASVCHYGKLWKWTNCAI